MTRREAATGLLRRYLASMLEAREIAEWPRSPQRHVDWAWALLASADNLWQAREMLIGGET